MFFMKHTKSQMLQTKQKVLGLECNVRQCNVPLFSPLLPTPSSLFGHSAAVTFNEVMDQETIGN